MKRLNSNLRFAERSTKPAGTSVQIAGNYLNILRNQASPQPGSICCGQPGPSQSVQAGNDHLLYFGGPGINLTWEGIPQLALNLALRHGISVNLNRVEAGLNACIGNVGFTN